MNASWTASSARSKSPSTRMSVATARPCSSRNRRSTTSRVAGSGRVVRGQSAPRPSGPHRPVRVNSQIGRTSIEPYVRAGDAGRVARSPRRGRRLDRCRSRRGPPWSRRTDRPSSASGRRGPGPWSPSSTGWSASPARSDPSARHRLGEDVVGGGLLAGLAPAVGSWSHSAGVDQSGVLHRGYLRGRRRPRRRVAVIDTTNTPGRFRPTRHQSSRRRSPEPPTHGGIVDRWRAQGDPRDRWIARSRSRTRSKVYFPRRGLHQARRRPLLPGGRRRRADRRPAAGRWRSSDSSTASPRSRSSRSARRTTRPTGSGPPS